MMLVSHRCSHPWHQTNWYESLRTLVSTQLKHAGNQNLYLIPKQQSNFLRNKASLERRENETICPKQRRTRIQKSSQWVNSRALLATRDLRKIYELCSIRIIWMTSKQWTIKESVRTKNFIVKPRCSHKESINPIGVCMTFTTSPLNIKIIPKQMKISITGGLCPIFVAKVHISKLFTNRTRLLPQEVCRCHTVRNRTVEVGLHMRLAKRLRQLIIITEINMTMILRCNLLFII